MTTLKDVARLASVDVSTASRALNNSAQVHPETKAKILMAAKKLGYKPELLSKSLLPEHRNLIAVILPTTLLKVYSEILSEFQYKAKARGYGTLVALNEANEADEAKALSELKALVDGVLIVPTGMNTQLIRELADQGLSIVQLLRRQDDELSSVTANYFDACRRSVHLLRDKGCSHIGLLHGSPLVATFKERLAGYRKGIQETGLPDLAIDSGKIDIPDYEDGRAGVKALIRLDPELDGILVEDDLQGMGALRGLKEQKIACPDRVRLISLTGYSLGAISETKLSAMSLPIPDMAEKALDLLLAAIEAPDGKKPCTMHVSFNAELKERETT